MSRVPASIVLIDGEHYPPVTARAIARLCAAGENPVLALLVGGREKLGQRALDVGIPVETAGGTRHGTADDAESALAAAIARVGAARVFDLSDEPVLSNARRCRLASVALWRGASYAGADFVFSPPHRPPVGYAPSVTVLGMGKRTGKTAVTGTAARVWRRTAGLRPVIVAMGRGGPEHPEVIEADADLSPAGLCDWVTHGRHAASDYVEDALFTGAPTVGTWRVGGGFAGATFFSDYDRALDRGRQLAPDLLVLESSGAAVPPAATDAGLLVLSAETDPADLYGYFGLSRLLLADLVVLTMCEEATDPRRVSRLEECVRRSSALTSPDIVRTVFRPHPSGDISGKRVWFATTAGPHAGPVLKRHLEEVHGAHVVGMSHALADRAQLRRDLRQAPPDVQVLATELKAAAVDVVTRFGAEHGIETVYVDNRVVSTDGTDVDQALLALADRARSRHAVRRAGGGPP
ncbi:hypothetical protein [Streptomyces sp. PA5.6]|uniref:hypothetical protein n=1 Tax=Streptomyces sp. PA5.6 TaxID=3035651 RepID=UPI003904D92E